MPPAFLGADPEEVLRRATAAAGALARILGERGLSLRLGKGGRGFLPLGAWQTLGALVGVRALVEGLEPLADGRGWQARAVALRSDGTVLAAGYGVCTHDEPGRQQAPDHALAAMAQGRALRRALQGALGWVLALAGPDGRRPEPAPAEADPGPRSAPSQPVTAAQLRALHALATRLGWSEGERHARAGVDSLKTLDRSRASELIAEWQLMTRETTP